MASISEVFPPDDPAARFVVSMSMARNDIEYALREANRTGHKDEPQFRYWTRITAGFLFNAAYSLSRWRTESEDCRKMLGKLPSDAGDHLKAITGLVQRLGPRTLEHSRDRTFHYPHPDRDPARTADCDLRSVLQQLGAEEATIHLSDDIPPRVWLEFADKVALMLTLGKFETDDDEKLRQQLTDIRDTAIHFVRFAEALGVAYFDDRDMHFGEPDYLPD